MNTEKREELEKLTDKELLERLKALKKLNFEKKFEAFLYEIDEIKEHGFSEQEAIELLKVAELRELNKQLSDTLYISGDITAYPGRVE